MCRLVPVSCVRAGVAGRDPPSSMVSHRCVLELNARNLYDFSLMERFAVFICASIGTLHTSLAFGG